MAESRSLIAAIAFGILAGVMSYLALSLLGAYAIEIGRWETVPRWVLNALILVGPGLVAGFAAGRSGFIVGGAAGLLVSVAGTILLIYVDRPGGSVLDGVASGLSNVITNGVGGIAGVAVSKSRGSDAF